LVIVLPMPPKFVPSRSEFPVEALAQSPLLALIPTIGFLDVETDEPVLLKNSHFHT
jgi:hypothetical protein